MSLPIGSSARLVLREAVPEDAAFMLALLNEPAWRRYIADHEIQTLAQAAQYIEDKLICAYREHGFGLWIVIEQVTGTAVGLCGFLKREALPVMDLGFAFRQAFWGRGYAKEASQAALDIAWQQGHSEVLAITLPKNQRAIRTLESLGFGYRSVFSYPDSEEELSLYACQRAADPAETTSETKAECRMQLLTGRCVCQAIVYQIEGPLGPIFNCHCQKCRRWHGAAFRTRATVDIEQFRWLAGEDLLSRYASSDNVTKTFCRVCGSNLVSYYKNRPDIVGLPIGGLEQDPGSRPEAHIFVASKSPWYTISDDLPQYDHWPGSEEKVRETR